VEDPKNRLLAGSFAIAQLESEHGRAPDARAALRVYLARHPHGRPTREGGDRSNRLSPVE
jgi:hypothetical protein